MNLGLFLQYRNYLEKPDSESSIDDFISTPNEPFTRKLGVITSSFIFHLPCINPKTPISSPVLPTFKCVVPLIRPLESVQQPNVISRQGIHLPPYCKTQIMSAEMSKPHQLPESPPENKS